MLIRDNSPPCRPKRTLSAHGYMTVMEPVAFFTTNTQVEAIECTSEPKPVVAIASSRLEGNRWDSEIVFIDEATHKVESVISGHWGGTADVAFAGNNCEILACGADDGKIYVSSINWGSI